MHYALVLLIGLVAGIAGGLFGIGGGLIMVPALMLIMKFGPKEAFGTSLAAMVPPVSLLGAREYWKAGYVDLWMAGLLTLGLAVGGYVGAKMTLTMDISLVKKIYGGFLILVGIRMIFFK